MSSFGVKSILHRGVIGLDQWFADSKEMCQYLRFRNDEIMVYSNINPKFIDKRRSKKKEIKIKGCMLGHLFVYQPNSTKILMNECFCDCESCLNLEFSSCKKPVVNVGEIGDDFLEECMVDEDDDRQSRIYEFVSTPSYVSLLSCNAVILYTSCSWRKRVKPLKNYKIGMVMLFFLANCVLKVDICISPVHVIQAKRNSTFSTVLLTLALVKFLKHLLSLMMI